MEVKDCLRAFATKQISLSKTIAEARKATGIERNSWFDPIVMVQNSLPHLEALKRGITDEFITYFKAHEKVIFMFKYIYRDHLLDESDLDNIETYSLYLKIDESRREQLESFVNRLNM